MDDELRDNIEYRKALLEQEKKEWRREMLHQCFSKETLISIVSGVLGSLLCLKLCGII